MARNQLYWEDVEEGAELPPLAKTATTLMLVKWAGASSDFNPLHYDLPFCRVSRYRKTYSPRTA